VVQPRHHGEGRTDVCAERRRARSIVRVLAFCLVFLAPTGSSAAPVTPEPGFVIHFDFISNAEEGRQLVRIAAEAGARVINVVPPARVWKNRQAREMLDAILDEIGRRHLDFVFARIDGAYPPDNRGERVNYLYNRILTKPGVFPDGAPVTQYFLTTAGLEDYDAWMEEETRYYARRYGRMPNLIGINLGPFSEPFSAERCGFLAYTRRTQRYEITQYTPQARRLWHRWLAKHFRGIGAVNREYATSFGSLDQIPLPINESDGRFGKPQPAFFDFTRTLNDWFVERYERCRRLWHEVSGRSDVPFILQFSGAELEKFVRGRPGYAAFDLPGWVERADAVGLSLYSNSGYPDFGHRSIQATVNLAALARDLGKEVFVLEGGYEAPNVVLDPGELEFFGTVALKLRPRTYIYEFLKDRFNESYASNPGKLVTADGMIRQPAFDALRNLFKRIEAFHPEDEVPALYVRWDSMAARADLQAGARYAALYDLAADLPVRWIPRGASVTLRADVPVVNPDGSITPSDERLSALLRSIPPVEAKERGPWREAVISLLRRSAH
jgi:hypothetical protein